MSMWLQVCAWFAARRGGVIGVTDLCTQSFLVNSAPSHEVQPRSVFIALPASGVFVMVTRERGNLSLTSSTHEGAELKNFSCGSAVSGRCTFVESYGPFSVVSRPWYAHATATSTGDMQPYAPLYRFQNVLAGKSSRNAVYGTTGVRLTECRGVGVVVGVDISLRDISSSFLEALYAYSEDDPFSSIVAVLDKELNMSTINATAVLATNVLSQDPGLYGPGDTAMLSYVADTNDPVKSSLLGGAMTSSGFIFSQRSLRILNWQLAVVFPVSRLEARYLAI